MSAVTVTQSNPGELIVGHAAGAERIRIQLLWDAVLRIELSRPDGSFCDQATFAVFARELQGPLTAGSDRRGEVLAAKRDLTLRGMPGPPDVRELYQSLRLEREGRTLWSAETDIGLRSKPPQPDSLPRPSEAGPVWVLHDRPRAIPPEWGSLPPPESYDGGQSGWRFEPEALDLYLFLYEDDVRKLYRLLTLLTGAIPLPPLWTFGFWHSRYHPYTEQTVLETIDRYRAEGFPLDVFVIDTDWRVGGSRGYDISTEHFPDMAHTLRACRERGVRTLFNDHPEPRGFSPLEDGLFRYRRENLTRMVDLGLTTWWFDRNWRDIIPGPAPGLETAVWGQKLFWDILSAHNPDRRTVLLSMAAGHPASHRHPIWWTGDIESDWSALGQAVRDSVDEGLQLRPYTGQDIGGHVGYPSPEQYVRWMQWGAVSPTFRLHSGPLNRFRYPWRFGKRALRISRDYVRFRYRLLPLFYTLAREAYETGVPMHRSMELFDPQAPSWTRERQFALGDDLIFAPVIDPAVEMAELRSPFRFRTPLERRIWLEPYWPEGARGGGELPFGPADEVGYDHEIRIDAYNSSEKRMAWKPGFHVVWDGAFEVPENGWYVLRLEGNGMKSLVVDVDFPAQLMSSFDTGDREVALLLSAGKKHRIRVTYQDDRLVNPAIQLSIGRAADLGELPPGKKQAWIPPGLWRDLWSGTVHRGPATIELPVHIHQIPTLARSGAILPLGPIPQHTGRAVWDPLTWEIFAPEEGETGSFTLYEDDGQSNCYQRGQWARSSIEVQRIDGALLVRLEEPRGEYAASIKRRSFLLRVHLPPGIGVAGVSLAGEEISETASVPAACSEKPWWKRLPAAGAPERRTPLSLSDDGPGYLKGETALLRVPAVAIEIRVRLRSA